MTHSRDPAAVRLFAHVLDLMLVRLADLFDKDWDNTQMLAKVAGSNARGVLANGYTCRHLKVVELASPGAVLESSILFRGCTWVCCGHVKCLNYRSSPGNRGKLEEAAPNRRHMITPFGQFKGTCLAWPVLSFIWSSAEA
ncbi:unnamed protein product [Protopolystoma xenopodis]|uniref:Uncharacterized protein n=1 Tax=Protopolystoma xenopodis TaxID=117903 RepID=A0A3S5CNY2_9PLAT|nr:unnamed protein product [Protopolystoma xenopodis]